MIRLEKDPAVPPILKQLEREEITRQRAKASTFDAPKNSHLEDGNQVLRSECL